MSPRHGQHKLAGTWIALCACLVGLVFSFVSLRGSSQTAVVDTDASRHAMNGAFLYDLVGSGQWRHPVQYAQWYYSRLPAISIPYHPPLFPAFEAVVYVFAGVNVPAARLAVALCVWVTGVLLIALVLRTHGSAPLAFGATLLFLALPLSRQLAGEVMLEFPAMACTVMAMLAFALIAESAMARGVLRFGLFAAMAIWTKQCVFLCLTPILYVVLARVWSWPKRYRFWLCLGIPAAGAAALGAVSWSQGWSGSNQTWAANGLIQQWLFNLRYYAELLARNPASAGLLIVLLGYAVVLFRKRGSFNAKRDGIYWAWLLSVLMILVVAPAYSGRYLFFAYPPALILLFSAAERLLGVIRGPRALLPGVAALYAVFTMQTELPFLRGPDEAARWVAQRGLGRVIYCGLTDGNFIFSLRSLQDKPETIVIRGEKLSAALFRGDALLAFARRYGVEAVILERTTAVQPWNGVFDSATPSHEVVMTSSQPRMQGRLHIILVEGSRRNDTRLSVPIDTMGRDVEMQLGPGIR